MDIPVFEKVIDESAENANEMWRIVAEEKTDYILPDDSDVALWQEGYIVIVPMKADEDDYTLMDILTKKMELLPAWSFSE
jgi:broad specificity polyphosphatase/5'/3'-nucleotidase SurE